jgi:malonyl-CoA O-methyltransferase
MLTDLSPDMLDQCRHNLGGEGGTHLTFALMNAEQPSVEGAFDLIAMSMTLHWLADPAAALERLRRLLSPRGMLVYAALSGQSFPEWREVLKIQGLPSGLIDTPALPGVVEEERIAIDKDPLAFLRRMKAVGGLTPKQGYRPVSPAMAGASPGTSSMASLALLKRASRAPRASRRRRAQAHRR